MSNDVEIYQFRFDIVDKDYFIHFELFLDCRY